MSLLKDVKGSIHHYHMICNLEYLNYLENNGAAMGELPFKTTLPIHYPYTGVGKCPN